MMYGTVVRRPVQCVCVTPAVATVTHSLQLVQVLSFVRASFVRVCVLLQVSLGCSVAVCVCGRGVGDSERRREEPRERDVDTTHRADLSIVKKHLTTSAIRACRRRAGIEITFRYNYISISIPDSIPQRYICTVLFKPYLKFCMCFTSLPYVP